MHTAYICLGHSPCILEHACTWYIPLYPGFDCMHIAILCEVLLSSTPAAGDAQPSAAKQYTDYFLGVSGIE